MVINHNIHLLNTSNLPTYSIEFISGFFPRVGGGRIITYYGGHNLYSVMSGIWQSETSMHMWEGFICLSVCSRFEFEDYWHLTIDLGLNLILDLLYSLFLFWADFWETQSCSAPHRYSCELIAFYSMWYFSFMLIS